MLPVMFWIHGGDLVYGSGNMAHYSPTPDVTKSTRAVYVSINYRLGPMGFLTLDTLSQSSPSRTSGNYGLMDMMLALHWVRDNIRNFGGNPNKVCTVISIQISKNSLPGLGKNLSSFFGCPLRHLKLCIS